ncbi:MAG: protein-disulfide reductase DsbD domain-containing protein [Candidatus Angelobacter sp.]
MAISLNIRLAASLLIALASSFGSSPQAPPKHADVELLSRQASVKPNSDLQLGVHFILEKGWHIYWINPGDSGQPPSFKWQLPPGFSTGEIRWPRPERMQPSRSLADFGYHDEVLLPLTIHAASSLNVSAPVEFNVEVKWLVCREVCIPEHADLHLSLPVGATARLNQQHSQLFAKTDKLLPQPLPSGWKVSFSSAKDDFIFNIRANKPITQAIFFPLDPGQVDNPAPQKLQTSHTGVTLTLKKSDLLLKPISVLRGVLVIPGGPAYRIEAPVRQPIQ